jgi:hypothetical protein
VATKVVTIDATDESITDTCAQYRADEVYGAMTAPAFDVRHFTGDRATRELVLPDLETFKPALLTASGHGFATMYTGQVRRPILEVGQYRPVHVHGTIIHFLSCEAGEALGADLVVNGCRAFFGYDDDFVFPSNEPELFLECDSAIDLTLMDGGTAEEAYEAAIDAFNKAVFRLRRAGRVWLAVALERNRNCLCAPSRDVRWGDPLARL